MRLIVKHLLLVTVFSTAGLLEAAASGKEADVPQQPQSQSSNRHEEPVTGFAINGDCDLSAQQAAILFGEQQLAEGFAADTALQDSLYPSGIGIYIDLMSPLFQQIDSCRNELLELL